MNATKSFIELCKKVSVLLIVWTAFTVMSARAEAQVGAFPISRCVYRVPYDVDVDAGEFVLTHSVNFLQLGHNGVDIFGQPDIPNGGSTDPPIGYPVVAGRAGVVRRVTDSNTECCRNSGCATCINRVSIQHNDDEFTVYFHIAPDTAQVVEGQAVNMGDIIAFEGDTGSVCANAQGTNNRPSTGCAAAGVTQQQAQARCPFCSVHLHFSAFYGYDGVTTGDALTGAAFKGQVIPIICNVDNSLFEPSEIYADGENDNGRVGNCLNDCPAGLILVSGQVGSGAVRIRRADVSVSASNYVIEDDTFRGACTTNSDCTLPARCSGGTCRTRGASVAFRAGDRVRLLPGFHAMRGSYFQGVISPCNGCPQAF